MNKRRLILALAVVVVLAATGYWFLRDSDGDRQTEVVSRGSLDVTIQTVGTLQATGASIVRASQGGVVQILGVRAGDELSAGDIIAILDPAPFDTAVRTAERELEQAEFALQSAEARAADDPANNELQLEVLNAAARIERANLNMDAADRAQRESVIVSPRDGTVLELSVRVGDAIGGNQQVARIASTDDLRIVADVDELDLPNVAPGAEARFRLDAFPSVEVTGTVVSTAPQARQQGGATVFATEITFEPPADLDIRPGMNADVTIVTAAREDILLIPEGSLRTVGDRSFVLVETGSGTDEREVELGYRGGGQVEVVAGLNEGDRVVLR